MHTYQSLTSMFVTKAHLLLDPARGSGLVKGGSMEEEIKERLTHTMRLPYFLVNFMLAYFSFEN